MAEAFNYLAKNNEWATVVVMASSLCAIYGSLIRLTHRAQFPSFIIQSEEKATGKTSMLRMAMFLGSSQELVFTSASSAEIIEVIGSKTTSIVAIDDIWSLSKEERLVVSGFEGTTYRYGHRHNHFRFTSDR